jgi:DNA-binding transcriptional MerR regulator
MEGMSIGVLAQRAGVSVRTLHHYDATKLLTPSIRTSSGARRYGHRELIRLHRILVLRQWGYSLAEIRRTLDDPKVDPIAIIRRQIAVLQEQSRQAMELTKRLQHVVEMLSKGREPRHSTWLELLEMAALYEQHLTAEEVRSLRRPLGANAADLQSQWNELVHEVRAAIRSRVPSSSIRAQAFAWRWVRLVIARTSNNPTLAIKLRTLQVTNIRAQQIEGIGAKTLDWIGQAIAQARTALFAKYLTASQTEKLRRRQLATMRDLDAWPRLVSQAREHMDAGAPVDAPAVQALARRWLALFRESYCGNDAAMEARVRNAFAREPDLRLGVGVSAPMMKYIHAAIDRSLERRRTLHANTT